MLETWLPRWKVQELETVQHVALFELVGDLDDLGHGQSKLGAIARRVGPSTDPLAAQLGSHAEAGTDTQLLRGSECEFEFFDALEYHDNGVVEALCHERSLEIGQIFVSIADDETVFVLHRCE